jgi:gamma-glutamyltranspeptidase/glutathione hydrolase
MQPQGHLQVGTNLVTLGMDPQTALDAPRFNWLEGSRTALEAAVPDKVRRALIKRGHDILPPDTPIQYGGGVWRWTSDRPRPGRRTRRR